MATDDCASGISNSIPDPEDFSVGSVLSKFSPSRCVFWLR
jgi:hypothetical protein